MSLSLFQSSPSPGAGRCLRRGNHATAKRCFNPRPARGPGAALGAGETRALGEVSILAQPGGRALRVIRPVFNCLLNQFQSSPSPGAGRCGDRVLISRPGAFEFQSSPSPGAGRCLSDNQLMLIDLIGFNPRPARGPGAAVAAGLHFDEILETVSILAQPGGRALPIPSLIRQFSAQVSILAQPGGRALPWGSSERAEALAFQSSPSPGAGRCLDL